MNNASNGTREREEVERQSTNLMRLFGQVLMFPLTALVYSMEMLVHTMRSVQRLTQQGLDVMAGGGAPTSGEAPEIPKNPTTGLSTLVANETTRDSTETTHKELRKMPDTNLSDDLAKLVRYKIIFIKRDDESVLEDKQEIVTDNITPQAYTAWKIAHFIQEYPNKVGEDDKKYLRVYFEVLDRYAREKEESQVKALQDLAAKGESQVKALQDIAAAIRKEPPPPPPPPAKAPGPPK